MIISATLYRTLCRLWNSCLLKQIFNLTLVNTFAMNKWEISNNLLADFSFVDSNTLSVLVDSYCMSIYGRQLFKLYDKNSVNCIFVAWRKAIRKIWKIPNISHCRLLPYINDCNYIDSILERRYIRFLYNIFNSENQLYTSMIKYSLTNCDSTLGENIRYLMHKYEFDMHQ